MEGLQPSGSAAPTGGWTTFSNASMAVEEVTADLKAARKAAGIKAVKRLSQTNTTTAGDDEDYTVETREDDSDVAASPAPVPAPSGPSAQLPTSMSSGGSAVNAQSSNKTAPAAAATTTTQANSARPNTSQATTTQLTSNLVANVQPTTTIVAQDQAVFANLDQLTGDTLLNSATRYSADDIAKQVNRVAGKAIANSSTVYSRVNRAIGDYAARAGLSVGRVKADLAFARKAAGVGLTATVKANLASQATTSQAANGSHTGNTSEDESDYAETQEVATAPPAFAPGLPAHTTEDESDYAELQEDVAAAPPAFTPGLPAPAAAATPPATDEELFANPERLFGNPLLALAESFTHTEISKRIGTKPGADKAILSHGGVKARINAALKSRAVGTSATLVQLRANLRAARAANGVKTRAPKGGRDRRVKPAPQAVVATTTPTAAAFQEAMETEMADAATANPAVTVQEAMDAEMADVATETPAVVAQEGDDVEMADAGNEAVQQRYTAAEMDAADALLTMFQTEDEASDTEMNDAERGELMTDSQANSRDSSGMR
jgi:hypothetical protein